jgi:hypothetical protein
MKEINKEAKHLYRLQKKDLMASKNIFAKKSETFLFKTFDSTNSLYLGKYSR